MHTAERGSKPASDLVDWTVKVVLIWLSRKSPPPSPGIQASLSLYYDYFLVWPWRLLNGLWTSTNFFIPFQMDKLLEPQVWLDAATQIFYSFGLAFGGLIAFSSYNPRNNNCRQDAIIISFCNWFTAIFACTVIFSILGFKATIMYENCVEQ